ncbi:hypothetical protein [Winogradskyella jejuensis]|uniref:Beta-lactamase-inhibitor-like, PepSY-like n=1 Tax=Winogradskyella jejuensis TaxID=1089305 RepID=A0A1M5NQF1_9FLAO|nr:hypothetical protein [Winogradskyella jejuensis]SHG91183.1 hypothetical protein SAMN05444148_1257 [Winogradskyella jejuensis]
MKSRFIFVILISSLICPYSLSQTKNEKEQRIKISKFPEAVQNVIGDLPKNCKRLKFYKETDGDKKSYEVKFKYLKHYYSIEFSEDGLLEDVEVITKFNKIDDSIKHQIKAYYNQSFKKHKFIKIQKQYVYNSRLNTNTFINNTIKQPNTTSANYEIIAEVTTDKKRDIREFTFNSKGKFLSSRILNPTSYEHVLY